MEPWKLPLIVLAIVVPIVAAFAVAGGGFGLGVGAAIALVIVLAAIAQRPRGPIESAPPGDAARHVLIVAAAPLEDPGDVGRVVRALGLDEAGAEVEVRVLVPARIGFLDRWASDVEAARRSAQERLVAVVAALAKARIEAEARVGDEDVVQAVEDQLQSYPATEVLLVGNGGEDEAAAELEERLRADFHHVRLGA
jgi:hypothetical protein